jgi:hypothetical protein
MPTLILRKDEMGQLAGLSNKDDRAFARWRKKLAGMEVGETVTFTWREPRSGPFHRRYFWVLNHIFDGQEAFTDPDMFRKWAEVGAGYAEFVPGPGNVMQAIPKSIDYQTLDDVEFGEVCRAVWEFLRSQHALEVLWPHRPWQQSWEAVDNWIEAGR